MADFADITDVAGGLVADLTETVDAVRDIATQLGARTDEVRLIWTRWTGGTRGSGEEYVCREVKIEPTPLVADLTSLRRRTASIGAVEEGDLRVSQISARYHERELLGQIDGRPIDPDMNFYWEVTVGLDRSDASPVRRRFVLTSPPSHSDTRFEWVVVLARAYPDRVPSGLPRGDPSGVIDG